MKTLHSKINLLEISEEILNKPLLLLTVREALRVIPAIKMNIASEKDEGLMGDEYAVGITQLAKLLKCGKTKAQELKNSGILDSAIHQSGKKIYINKRKLAELIDQKKI